MNGVAETCWTRRSFVQQFVVLKLLIKKGRAVLSHLLHKKPEIVLLVCAVAAWLGPTTLDTRWVLHFRYI